MAVQAQLQPLDYQRPDNLKNEQRFRTQATQAPPATEILKLKLQKKLSVKISKCVIDLTTATKNHVDQ
jgi:hypothetical protein